MHTWPFWVLLLITVHIVYDKSNKPNILAHLNCSYVTNCVCVYDFVGEPAAVGAACLHLHEDEASNHGALARL